MSYTRKQWAVAFLQSIGNNNPSNEIVNWVIAWTDGETACCKGAAYNLLNTTQDMQGATAFNHFGSNGQYSVKNYTSFDQGIQANTIAIKNGYYPAIYSDLKSNNFTDLMSNPAVAKELSTWGTGGTGRSINNNAGKGANDQFSGDATQVQQQNNNSNSNSNSNSSPLNQSLFQSYGEHIGVFLLAILFIILGIAVLARKQVKQAMKVVALA